jgi:hypothetical protein
MQKKRRSVETDILHIVSVDQIKTYADIKKEGIVLVLPQDTY